MIAVPSGVSARYAALRRAEHPAPIGDDELAAALTEGIEAGAEPRSVIVHSGRYLARWRDAAEPELFASLAADHRGDALWRAAADARLLVAPIRSRPRRALLAAAQPSPGPSEVARAAAAPVAAFTRDRLRVVDWSSLWAGPWATGILASRGDDVVRIEHPGRRDGMLATARGRELWERWNGAKRLVLADATSAPGREAIARELGRADLIVSGHTARVLPQLGFTASWFARHAPRALVIELRAYEPPFEDAPGLGEHAAAVSGLLRDGVPRPWADPLLGARALLAIREWRRAGRPPGRIALSLEAAAASAYMPTRDPRHSIGRGFSPL